METQEIVTRSIEVLKGQDLWKAEAAKALQQARAVKVVTADDYSGALALRDKMTARGTQLKALLNPGCQASDQLHKTLVADRDACVDPYLNGAKIIKQETILWEEEEKRKAKLEQARLDAIAKKKSDDDALELAAALEQAGQTEAATEALENPAPPAPVVAKTNIPEVEGKKLSYRSIWSAVGTDIKAMLQGWKDGKVPTDAFLPNDRFLTTEAGRLKEAAIGMWPGVQVTERKI